ncbi:MAG: hypothetical protein HRF42_14550 [Candidatus Brocadia sp.]|jgi:hypothetical protein
MEIRIADRKIVSSKKYFGIFSKNINKVNPDRVLNPDRVNLDIKEFQS